MQERGQEEVQTTLPRDRVIRLKRKRRLRPKLLNWTELTGVIRELVFETPFFIMPPILLALLLLFSAGIYFAENGVIGSNVNSYGGALWDGVVLMATADGCWACTRRNLDDLRMHALLRHNNCQR